MGLVQMAKSRAPTFRGLPVHARLYIPAVIALAAGAVVAEQALMTGPSLDAALLAIAIVLCAVGNLFEVFAPANFSFQPNLVVFLAASLLLPPWAIAVLAVVSFVPGWMVHRFPWYMVAFNVANYTVAGAAAHAIVHLQGAFGSNWSPSFESALALGAAAIAFVLVNHILIVCVVTLARGRALRRSIDDLVGCLPIDTALALTGACFAALWAFTPPLALLAAGPMVLVYRALWIPLLEHKSRTDPKTGLFNSEYLGKVLEDALEAASRHGSRLSIVMIDLDQLRLINNRHGHLAGDEIIRAVSEVVAESAGASEGIAARFGGDELCILLLATSLDRAREVADGIRARIEAIEVPAEDGGVMAITASTGIAAYPDHADTVDGLLRAADAAVYDAKLGGRNRTRTALPPAVQRALALDVPARGAQEPPAIYPEAPAPELNGHPPETEQRRRRRGRRRGLARQGPEHADHQHRERRPRAQRPDRPRHRPDRLQPRELEPRQLVPGRGPAPSELEPRELEPRELVAGELERHAAVVHRLRAGELEPRELVGRRHRLGQGSVRQPPGQDRPVQGELEPRQLVPGLLVHELRQVALPQVH
jgi:diguanylate cyclase